jgi:small redox-active disulfide protein 2
MVIKVLGSGCAKCKKLEANVVEALKNSGVTAEIEHVTEYEDIMKYNIMSTPGLVVDEKVVSAGKVLKPKAIEELLK